MPRPCSAVTRPFARSTSVSYSPNWIESVGQALAQAGSSPSSGRVEERVHLGAGRLEPVLEAVVAERALGGAAVLLVAADHAERARRDAVAAAVADVGLHDDRVELRAEEGASRAGIETAGVGAVLADVRHEQPAVAAVLRHVDEVQIAV